MADQNTSDASRFPRFQSNTDWQASKSPGAGAKQLKSQDGLREKGQEEYAGYSREELVFGMSAESLPGHAQKRPMIMVGGVPFGRGVKFPFCKTDMLPKADDFTRAQAQLTQAQDALKRRDAESVKLVQDAVRANRKVERDARGLGYHPQNHTVVSFSEDEAKVCRALMQATRNQFSTEQGIERDIQPGRDNIDWDRLSEDFGANIKDYGVERMRPRTLDSKYKPRFATDDSKGQVYSGVIGVVAAPSATRACSDFLRKRSEETQRRGGNPALFAPEGRELRSAIQRINGARYIAASRQSDDQQTRIENLALKTDQAVVFTDAKTPEQARNAPEAAYAAELSRQGKLFGVYDSRGNKLDRETIGAVAKQAHPSPKEKARQESLATLDMDAASGEARLALSLAQPQSKASRTFSDNDINTISSTGMNVTELMKHARTDDGREFLSRDLRLSRGAVAGLADEESMAVAANKFHVMSDAARDAGFAVIGPDRYPDAMLAKGNIPPALYARGNIESLTEARNTTAVIGDPQPGTTESQQRLQRIVANTAAPATNALTSNTELQTITAQGAYAVTPQPGSGHIHVLAGGYETLATADREFADTVLANDGVLVSKTNPMWRSAAYDKETQSYEGSQRAIANDSDRANASRLAAQASEALVVTGFDRQASTSPTKRAIEESLQSGTDPIALPHAHTGNSVAAVSGNVALLKNTGTEALRKAGLDHGAIDAIKDTREGSRGAANFGNDPEKAVRNIANTLQGRELEPPEAARSRQKKNEEDLAAS